MLHELLSALLFQGGYNTTVVIMGAAALGAAGGAVGVFAMLRGRALVADAISHATLPGVALGFMTAYFLGYSGRSLFVLLGGAALTAAAAVFAINAIRRHTRLKEDAAVASVLGVFFGLGIALLSIVQGLPTAGQAGLDAFLLGSTAGIRLIDAAALAVAAVLTLLLLVLVFKELRVAAFDPVYALAHGLRPDRADAILLILVLIAVVLGLRTVGLVLAVALLVIAPAAARFWSERLGTIVLVAAGLGAIGAWLGASLSAAFSNLPAGATIVLVLFGLFIFSFIAGAARGMVPRYLRRTNGAASS
jgi:manganese/zinc/iron transport system permease protein